MDAPACSIELKWIENGEPQQLSHRVKIIGAKEPANFFRIRYSPQAVGELCRHARDMCLLIHCIYANIVSISTVPNTSSGATPTVQDVTASPAVYSKQGMSVHDSFCCLTFINMQQRVPYADMECEF